MSIGLLRSSHLAYIKSSGFVHWLPRIEKTLSSKFPLVSTSIGPRMATAISLHRLCPLEMPRDVRSHLLVSKYLHIERMHSDSLLSTFPRVSLANGVRCFRTRATPVYYAFRLAYLCSNHFSKPEPHSTLHTLSLSPLVISCRDCENAK